MAGSRATRSTALRKAAGTAQVVRDPPPPPQSSEDQVIVKTSLHPDLVQPLLLFNL